MKRFDLEHSIEFALVRALQDNAINENAEIAHEPMQEDCIRFCGLINTRFVAEVVAGVVKIRYPQVTD